MKHLLVIATIVSIVIVLISESSIQAAEPIDNSTSNMSQLKSLITTPSEYNGTNFLTYVKYGGLDPINQIYIFNIFTKEISFVDVKNNTIVKKNLNETQLKLLNDVVLKQFSSDDKKGILDDGSCADCIKHGLDYVYAILNPTLGRQAYPTSGAIWLTSGAVWSDATPPDNVAGFLNITATLEKLMK
jgi:hypothetical protein